MAPRAIATEIVDSVEPSPMVRDVSIAGPGFINFKLDDEWLRSQIHTIRERGVKFTHLDVGAGKKVQVEFVSVNPTGPLHIGHVRGAVIGNGIELPSCLPGEFVSARILFFVSMAFKISHIQHKPGAGLPFYATLEPVVFCH